jgi:hypothetical protein
MENRRAKQWQANRNKRKRPLVCVCVCGRRPCTVKMSSKYMLSCPATTKCAMRSRWASNEQAAIIDWNTAVKSARQERKKNA